MRTLYAVVGPPEDGDRAAALVDGETGECIYSHISSSRWWAEQDVTKSFGRDYELQARYPDGYEVVVLDSWTAAPAEVRQRNDLWAALEEER